VRTLLKLLGVIVVLFLGAFAYFYFRSPETAPPLNIVVDKSPERVERGKYIFTHVSDCDFCHSEQDITRLALPIIESTRGQGKLMPDTDLPGHIYARNITPDVETGIGSWTDGEKIRAIREGVDKDGKALFNIMPYSFYRYMSDDDVQSLVAYLDSLPPIKHVVPPTQVNFPASMWMKGDPRPVSHPYTPPPSSADEHTKKLANGEYLATIAHCEVCHTPYPGLKEDVSLRFAGGRHFITPVGDVYSANITPDKTTGIGDWDLKRFEDRLKIYRQYENAEGPPVVGPDRLTFMPYQAFAGLTDYDMECIYDYLMTRTPLDHKVEPHPGMPERKEP
jgi:hypothetical protein